MQKNFFKVIRKSYLTGTLLTSILSNVIVFGQPIQQMTQRINQLEAINGTTQFAHIYNHNINNKVPSAAPILSEKVIKQPVKKNTYSIFYALEEQAVIGVTTQTEKENPRDNFFTVILPESLNLDDYDVVLKYDVFGVTGAEQTTKSINNNIVFGGQTIKLNKVWTSIEEYLPKKHLKAGKNEIFFNRKVNKNYLYKIKDLSIELVKKRSESIFIISKRLINYNGNLHLVGFVNDDIKHIEVLGQIITIKDGIFEYVFNEVPKGLKTLTVSYGDSLKSKEEFEIIYKDDLADYTFPKTASIENVVIQKNSLGVLSLDALTIENSSNESGLTKSQLQIEGIGFEELRPLNSDVVNVTSGGFLGYRLKKLNITDSNDFELHLKYDKTKIPDGYTDKDVRTFSFDKERREWVALPVKSLNYENKVVISKYNGDTDYINGVIKVPEMAETSSFTPTTITDMKYADPSAGIVSIATPSPNSNGNVSTNFPIKLPAGRNGMMPNLGVNYNSEAGNDWMGIGWNLQLPSITLETRWGTPRFDSTTESEIYQLNGETLTLKVGDDYTNPHRHNTDIPRSIDRTFFLRKEGSYLKIVRLGSSPSNYKWEVTDKYGNKSFYGTVANTVVRDVSLSSGNITHWALYKTEDPYGNYVIYEYDKGIASTQETNGVAAQFFYPKSIQYTLHGSSTSSYYQVDFIRKVYSLGGSGSINRTDVTLSARNGVMMAEHELLTEIKVKYYDGQSKSIRSYRFDYTESAFKKMQLSKIAEYDSSGNLFYTNTMEYYNEIGSNPLINSTPITWNGVPDSMDSPLLDMAPSNTPVPSGSALGTSTTSGFSAGLRTGAGIGWRPTSVNNTIGGSYNYSQAKEKTRISFLDINGDGLPDKVYAPNSGSLKYLPNLGIGINGQGVFGSPRSIINGINELDNTKSKTNTTGADANLFGLVGAGKSWSTTRATTDGYFTDVNGDGLPDVISGGAVKFNKTPYWDDTNPPNLGFNSDVSTTQNPIISGAINTSLIDDLDLETKDELREEHSQFDHVKVWKAPYTGTIKITGAASLLNKNNCDDLNELNQFRLWIERSSEGQNNLAQIVGSSTKNFSTEGLTQSYNLIGISVTKGDLFFFRIHNRTYGCGGEVEWNPIVTYTSSSNIPNSTDEHGKQYRVFNAENDYMVNNGGGWTPDKEDSSIAINWNLPSFNQYQFSDDVHFRIEKTKTQHNSDPNDDNYGEPIGTPQTWIMSKTYNHNTGSISGYSISPAISLTSFNNTSSQFVNGSSYSYEYRFYVESDSNVQWDLINWQPIITGSSSGQDYAPVSYIVYDTNINQSNYQVYGNGFPNPNIDPTIPNDEDNPLLRVSHNMFDVDYSQFIVNIEDVQFPIKINWIIKEEINAISRVLHKRTFYLHRNDCYNPPFNQPDFCNYTFRTTSSPTSSEINLSNSFYEPYFQFDLTKDKVQEIKNSSGKLYASFYLEHPEFGQNNNGNISISLHPDQNGSYSFNTQILDSPFIAKQPAFFGWSYRGWGQFLYNGGLKFQYDDEGNIISTTPPTLFDGAIDMSVFDYGANPDDLQSDIDNSNPDDMDLNNTAIRYSFYTQVNEFNKYENIAIKNKFDEVNNIYISTCFGYNSNNKLTTLLGRFAEPNIYDLWTDPATLINGTAFVGLKQRSKSKGKSTSGNVGIGAVGASGTKSEASSKVLNQYIDLNGDRYPDIITDGNIQFTSMKGGLSSLTLSNNFVSGGESKDDTVGVTISGVTPNSTKSDNNNNTRTNVNSGINASNGNSYDNKQWNDINGDGLTDRVTIYKSEIRVQLNTGYGFSDEVVWGSGYDDLYVSTRNNIGFGGGFGTGSFAAGFGAAESTANLNAALIDVNADGLPDLVEKIDSFYKFYLNNGTGFESTAQQTFYNGSIDKDVSFSGNIYASFTAGFVVPIYALVAIIPLKFTFTPTAGVNAGVNEKRIMVQDIDGDGYPDVLKSGSDNGDIVANLNKIGKTNLLKTVNTPLGGSWTVDYNREGNTYDMPQNKWVLNEIKTHDGFIADDDFGPNETLTKVSYENPKDDRREREFLGFGEVKIVQKDPSNQNTFRYSIAEYHNDNIYLKGLVKRTAVFDASDTILSESTSLYNIMDPENPTVNLNSDGEQHYLQTGLSESLLDYSRLFIAPVKTVSTTYEAGDGLSAEQQFTAYDNKGNLLTYNNLGDTYTSASPDDAYRTELEYYSSISGLSNSIGFVKKIQVKRQSDGQLLRQREAEYNNQGKLSKVITKLNSTETNEVVLFYDNYGNINQSVLQNGFETNVAYDTVLHTYPIQISNSFNETSTTTYDYLFGIPVLATDLNGQQLRTRIDNRGRLVEVTAPNEMPNSWTIRMQYQEESAAIPSFNGSNYVVPAIGSFQAINPGGSQPTLSKHHAVTRHNVTQAHENQLLTVSLVDGMGKAIQLKKTLYANTNSSNQVRWLVSGKENKDAFGRVVEAYLPTFQTGYPIDPNNLPSSVFDYIADPNTIPPTVIAYDNKDRVISVTQPGESQTATTSFGISDGMFLTTSINELGQTFETYTDVRGRQRKSIQNSELTTQFYYNTVGDKIKVKNQQGYETFYKYDLAGRRVEERHPDHGLQTFKYDVVGNLLERSTSNLLTDGQQLSIKYLYDYNRLKEVIYPQNPENNIKYTYGIVGNTDAEARNAVGRLYIQEDASGVQGYGYDKLGNLNNHLRGVAVAGRHTFWYHTQWTYDSHNRVQQIVYPDGEIVDYNYNFGGTLNSITRSIIGVVSNDPIVSSITYNDLGERAEITYGNGTSTSYTYDNRRRLKNLSHQFSGFGMTYTNQSGQTVSGIQTKYSYDALSNIEAIETLNANTFNPSLGQLGGPINHTYEYDGYNRLIHAEGRYTGPNDLTSPLLAQEYSLDMKYDLAHNIISKTQTHIQGAVDIYSNPITNAETMTNTNYHLDYGGYATGVNVIQTQSGEFGYVQPHAPREIIETPYSSSIDNTDPNYKKNLIEYDANGNQKTIKQVITEEQQLPAYEGVVEQQEIIIQKNLWDEEDRLRAVDTNPDDLSAHPLAVYTYDASGQRSVRYVPRSIEARSNANNVSKNERNEVMIYPSALVTAKALSKPGIEPNAGDLVSSYTKHYYIGGERINSTLGTVEDLGLYPPKIEGMFPSIRYLANQSVLEANTGLNETYLDLGQTLSLNAPVVEGSITRFTHDVNKYDAYWYHSDHLGSSNYITNLNGTVIQHIEYLPYGETLVDEHLNSYNTPYKFNAKELDAETGNYYYGARYYNPKWSVWLSTDPLSEKMPSWSSYNYAFSNPIKFIDPTGMSPSDPSDPTDPPTNSQQVNSQIAKIRAEHPDSPIYLMVQTDTGEGRDREEARNPNNLSYDLYKIQEGSDYSNGSYIVSVRHGEKVITGGIVETIHTKEIEASFSLTFKGNGKVGGADELTTDSQDKIPLISEIINGTGQSATISSHTVITGDKPFDPSTVMANGLMNGNVGKVNVQEFGMNRINTIINSLSSAGTNNNLLTRGEAHIYNSGSSNRRDGTFLDFRFSSPALRNANRRTHSGTINLNKGKFQIF